MTRPGLSKSVALGTALACAMLAHASVAEENPMHVYSKLDPTAIAVSGVSSGAFFAHQFHVAFSSLVKGAGIVAGGPYACADKVDNVTPPVGNPFFASVVPRRVVAALAVCTRFATSDFQQQGWRFPSSPDAAASATAADANYRADKIDNPANLQGSRVWLLHGTRDTVVPDSTMQALKSFYELKHVAHIESALGADAAHGMPINVLAPASAKHCALPERNYLIKCDYSAAELLLGSLYPGGAAPSSPPSGKPVPFSQVEFIGDKADASVSLGDTGYLYVPQACENDSASTIKCRLHVAFHSCEQYAGKIHEEFVKNAGYNGWADANHIIVLYPQTTKWLRLTDPSQLSANPQGCWDWWGYSGDDYLTRDGKQMKAVKAMVDRLLPR